MNYDLYARHREGGEQCKQGGWHHWFAFSSIPGQRLPILFVLADNDHCCGMLSCMKRASILIACILICAAAVLTAPLHAVQKSVELKRTLEQRYPDDPWIQKGFAAITTYGADPTGVKDSTAAIQQTVDVAYQNILACFFRQEHILFQTR
jgi:hypothetical protein